jgi:hypothetical protein
MMVGTKIFSMTTWHKSCHSTLVGVKVGGGATVGDEAKRKGEIGGGVLGGRLAGAEASRDFHNSMMLFENHRIPYYTQSIK